MRARALAVALVVGGAVQAEPPNLAHAPPLPPAPSWTATAPEVTTAPGGARVAVLGQKALPLVHVTVAVQAGSELDPPERPGLAALTARALHECGAGERSAAQQAEALDDLGDELQVETDESGARFSLTVVSTRLPRALALLGDLVARPRFDGAAFAAARTRQVAELVRRQDRPTEVAEEAFMAALYGAHPYAHSPLGTVDAVEKITLDEARAFWASRYGPRTTTVVLVGDAQADRAAAEVGRALHGWRGKAAPPPPPPAPVPPPAREVRIARAGAPQSEVRLGVIGASWSTPDLAALSVLETVLGGSFTSRLNQNLREKHGYTYGVHAEFRLLRAAGPFVVSAAIRADATADAIREMRAEIASMHTPMSADELAKAKALVHHHVIEIFGEGNAAASSIAELALNDQPLDFYSRFPAAVDALDATQLALLAKRLFPPTLTLVIVGDTLRGSNTTK